MNTVFLEPSELKIYFEQGNFREDCLNQEAMAICSIADLLQICEDHKKNNLNISKEKLKERFRELVIDKRSFQNQGIIHIADLDQIRLSAALFDWDDSEHNFLWNKAVNSEISPRCSIRYLTLKITDDSVWWSDDVYIQMEVYHSSLD